MNPRALLRVAFRALSPTGRIPTGLLALSLLAGGLGWSLRSLAREPWSPPWVDDRDIPLDAEWQSFEVRELDAPIVAEPRDRAAARGAAAQGARLPVYGARREEGCHGRWLLVGPDAWICQDRGALSRDLPVAPALGLERTVDGLPFRYFFVGSEGSATYASPDMVSQDTPDEDLQPGFGIAIVRQLTREQQLLGQTRQGQWVALQDLIPAHATMFHGEPVQGKLELAWAFREQTPLYEHPGGPPPRDLPRLSRWQLVQVQEVRKVHGVEWVRVDDGKWMLRADLRIPSLAEPPAEVAPQERWIDIDRAEQTLVLYEGARPVFATLVSTGKGGAGSPFETPAGVFRVWVKLRTSTMSNLDDEEAASTYSLADVPYVQFFSKGVGLHAAFWHHAFGTKHSHGCVNLAPLDAQWLFSQTSPRVAAGWWAALPTEFERGTVIRVH